MDNDREGFIVGAPRLTESWFADSEDRRGALCGETKPIEDWVSEIQNDKPLNMP